MNAFFEKHKCNAICKAIKLKRHRKQPDGDMEGVGTVTGFHTGSSSGIASAVDSVSLAKGIERFKRS